jgi:hypothetical protein
MKLLQATHRKLFLGLAAAMLLVSLPIGRAVAAAPKAPAAPYMGFQNRNLDFDLVNHTGYEIRAVLISPSRQANWNENDNVIQGRRFPDNEKLHIRFSPHAHAAHWDMKVIYMDHTSKEWDDLNLDNINKISLYYDARTGHTHADVQ